MESGHKLPLKPNPRESASLLSGWTFFWTLPVFRIGVTRDYEEADLFQPLQDHTSGILGAKLEGIWNDVQKEAIKRGKTPSLLKALVRCFGREFLCHGIVLAVTELFLRVVQPIFLGWLVAYFSRGNQEGPLNGLLYAALVVLCSAICVWVIHPYMMNILHLGMKLRVATCSLAYRKILRLDRSALKDTTPGQMVNLLSNDVGRFDIATIFLHYLWIGPVQTLIITGLLVKDIGWAPAVVGVASVLMYAPLQGYFGKLSSMCRMRVAVRTDERVRLMNEIISGIQVIKMYAWEIPFQKMVSISRQNEMKQIMRSNLIRGTTVSFIIFAMRVAIFMCILTYVLLGEVITAEKVFIITAYFSILRQNMTVFFPQGIGQLAEGLVSVSRLQRVMLLPELQKSPDGSSVSDKGGIVMKNIMAKWDVDQSEYTLNDINLKVPSGALAAVVGHVGAGKSSLLNVILRELSVEKGDLLVGGTVSYAAQEPWLFAGTVRQNILFGEPMDPHRYKEVIRVCALRADLALFPQGDRTIVGERGVSLSGGQRARISLARAVYRDADIYLLDDPLSAVDAHVSSHLFNDCIKKFLAGKTRILVTHQLQYLESVDEIFILNNSRLGAHGSYAEVKNSGLEIIGSDISQESVRTSAAPKRESISRNSISRISMSRNSISSVSSISDSIRSSFAQSMTECDPVMEREERASGAVGLKVFTSYFRAAGNCCYVLTVLSLFVWCQLLASAADYWITLWVEFEENEYPSLMQLNSTKIWYEQWPPNRDTTIYIYGIITVAMIVVTLARSFLFFHMSFRSSQRLHDDMFASISFAKMRFFNTNPSGRILNRFSKDMGSIDEIMPLCMIDAFQIGITMLAVMVMVSIINYWLMIPLVVLTAVSLWLRDVFMKTSRSIKRLEGVTRSPVFSYMNASLNGLTTVRALQMEPKLIQEFDKHQDLHSSAWFLFLATSRAFGYWLDQLCLIFICAVTFSFLIGSHIGVFGGNVGLAITQAISLTGMLQWGMRQEAEVENHMSSVERVLEYSSLPSEPPLESPAGKRIPKSWPEFGHIEFSHVFMHYDLDDPPVLKNLNFVINAQEKVGIVGRTGAGKSSLISALFRLEEIRGRIAIDGLDTGSIGLHELRKILSIIPQEPVLFNATIRKNLDPFDDYPDEILWGALQEVELKEVVEEMGCGLQSPIQEGGSNLSVGQRQLVCLARAIVRNNRVLVLDEATANVDLQTDSLIQRMIRDKFAKCTVLTIAHRLNTIMDSDKVLVMDAGTCVQFDHPHILLQNTSGIFYKMVEKVGESTSKKLMEVAKNHYELKYASHE